MFTDFILVAFRNVRNITLKVTTYTPWLKCLLHELSFNHGVETIFVGLAHCYMKKVELILKFPSGVNFVVALDPAGKYFEVAHPDARLDSRDVQFVDVIHTDSDGSGLEKPLGHLDFYPNGGEDQKGCGLISGRNLGFFRIFEI